MTEIRPSDARLQYMGRIDFSDPDAPEFIWAGSLVRCAFTGGALTVRIANHRQYNGLQIGYFLDGKEHQLSLSEDADLHEYRIPVSGAGVHALTLFKRQDSTHSFALHGLQLADGAELLMLPPLPERKLEFFGDSVTAGSVVEAVHFVGQPDPPVYDSVHDNAWRSYAMQTARLLDAQVHLTAQGGIALLDNSGYFDNGRFGMETAFDKLRYFPADGMTPWDFSRYVPDIVIINIGQNDGHFDGKTGLLLPERRERWLKAYCRLLCSLMEKYPKAVFVLTLTIVNHDAFWEILLDDVCERMHSERVRRFRFTRTGAGTSGHPRIPEQCEMACELTEYLKELFRERN